jgi:hypothetical protein
MTSNVSHSPSVRCAVCLVALTAVAQLAACDAQRPAATGATTTSVHSAATPAKKSAQFSEPAVTGLMLDADTQKPIAGVVIFGHYATVQGSVAGGESIAQVLHTFEVETDANGSFTIPAWDSGDQAIKGEPRSRFPMIGFYKDGYAFAYKNLQSLRHWVPSNKASTQDVTIKDNVYDWRAKPHLMTAVSSEKERYRALIDSRDGHVSVGECGWEKNVKFLMAQHLAWKDWYARNVPSDQLDKAGYPKDSYSIGAQASWGISNPTTFDRLTKNYQSNKGAWQCAAPDHVFGDFKK